MASHLAAAPMAAPDAAAGAPKLGSKRKEPEPDRQDEAILDGNHQLRPSTPPPVVTMDVDGDEDRELAEWVAATADHYDEADGELIAEWMAAAADELWALIHEWQAKLGMDPAPDHLEPYDLDPERFDYLDSSVLRPEGCEEKESKRRLGRDGLVRYLD